MAKPVRSQAKDRRSSGAVEDERVPRPDEIDRLRQWAATELVRPSGDWLDTQAAALVMVLFGTAARRFEACALRVGSIYRSGDGPVCVFPETKGGLTGVQVPVSEATMRCVERWLELRRERGQVVEDDEPLFVAKPREPVALETLRSYWRRACERAGIGEYGIHAARHGSAYVFLKHSRDLYALKKFLRHSSIKTTEQVYAHFLQGDLRESIEGAGL